MDTCVSVVSILSGHSGNVCAYYLIQVFCAQMGICPVYLQTNHVKQKQMS